MNVDRGNDRYAAARAKSARLFDVVAGEQQRFIIVAIERSRCCLHRPGPRLLAADDDDRVAILPGVLSADGSIVPNADAGAEPRSDQLLDGTVHEGSDI